MEEEIILTIVGIAFALLSWVFGKKWQKAKALLKEVGELLIAVYQAAEDDTVTKEELALIMKELDDVTALAQEIFGSKWVRPDYREIIKKNREEHL